MGLVACRVELTQRPVVGVLLSRHGPLLREIVSDSRGRREVEALKAAKIGGVQNRINDDVDGMQVQSDDRSNLRGEAPGIPLSGIDAEFEIHAIEKRGVGRFWLYEQRAQLEPVERPAQVLRVTVQRQVEPRL